MEESKMKRVSFFLLILAAASIPLFARGQSNSGAIKIAYMGPHQNNEYQVGLRESMERYAKELGLECTVYIADNDPAKQVSQIEQAIIAGVQGIVIDPCSYEGIYNGVIAAKNAKIPMVMVHENVSNQNDATAFIGPDFTDGGRQKMTQVMKDLPNGGNLAILYGPMGHTAQIAITNGYTEIHESQKAKYPYIFEGEGLWEAPKALELASSWLSSGKQIDAFVCNNDGMAIGALNAVTEVGKVGQILIYGLDAQQDVMREIKKGTIRATIRTDSGIEVKEGIDTVLKAIRGEPYRKEYLFPMTVVTKDNVDQYLK
jgi:ribose transport system substrate-binding protein/inositol transport system substrate-binding protein